MSFISLLLLLNDFILVDANVPNPEHLALWLDARDYGTLTSSSNKVTSWTDKSGSGFSAVQQNANHRPTFRNDTNGQSSIQFDGIDDRLILTNFDGLTNQNDYTICLVGFAVGSNQPFVSGISGGRLGLELASHGNRPKNMVFRHVFPFTSSPSIGDITSTSSSDYSRTQHQLVCVWRSLSSLLQSVTRNGDSERQAATRFLTQSAFSQNFDLTIGGASGGLNGQIAEILIYNSALDSADIATLELHLIKKWNLPVAVVDCESSPCQHGGTCIDGIQRTCQCVQGFEGEDCSRDVGLPSLVVSLLINSPTSESQIPFQVVSNEPIRHLDASHITVNGGDIQSFRQISELTYTFDVRSENLEDTIDVMIQANAVRDLAGNPNIESNQVMVVIDAVSPRIQSLSTTSPSPSSESEFTTTVIFSEDVVNFSLDKVTVVNGLATSFLQRSLHEFSFRVEAIGSSATVKVGIPYGAVKDFAGNSNLPASDLVYLHDSEPPRVRTLSCELPLPTSQSSIPVTVQFTEDVVGFSLSGIAVVGAQIGSFAAISPSKYAFDVLAIETSSQITVWVREGVARDLASNLNHGSLELLIQHDSKRPTVELNLDRQDDSELVVTAQFSEPVLDFSPRHISIEGASITFLDKIDDSTFYFFVKPHTSTATIPIHIRDGIIVDPAGNPNVRSDQLIVEHDTDKPTVKSMTFEADGSNYRVQVEFSEPVIGFSSSSLQATNAVALTTRSLDFDLGEKWEVVLQPASSEEDIYLMVPNGVVSDGRGNPNKKSLTLDIHQDSRSPEVVEFKSLVSSPTDVSPIPFIIKFGEPVLGFMLSDIIVEQGSAHNFNALSLMEYLFDVTPSSSTSDIVVTVPTGCVADVVGHLNTLQAKAEVFYDSNVPFPVLKSDFPNPTSMSPILVSVHFSEDVSGFSAFDLEIDGGVVESFESVSRDVYQFSLVPSSPTEHITIDIPAGVALDDTGNQNRNASTFSIYHDSKSPTVTFSPVSPLPSTARPLVLIAEFSEPVTGFTAQNMLVDGCSLTNFEKITSSTFQFELFPYSSMEAITVTVVEGAAIDFAGNPNLEAQFSQSHDSVPPSMWLTSVAEPTSKSLIPIDIQFSEPVTGFDINDVSIERGQIKRLFVISTSKYQLDVIPTSAQVDILISVPEGICTDTAGNANTASKTLTISHDSVPPTVLSLVSTAAMFDTYPIPVTLRLSEPAKNFDDLSVLGGFVETVSKISDQEYIFDIMPLSSTCKLQVSVAVGAFEDLASNTNEEEFHLDILFDSDPPVISSLSTPDGTVVSKSIFPVIVEFSEPIVGLSNASFNVDGGYVSSITQLGERPKYSCQVVAESTGEIKIELPDAAVTDLVGHPSSSSQMLTIFHDLDVPQVVSLTTNASSPNSVVPITFFVVFSEPVIGFSRDSAQIANGVVGEFKARGDGQAYEFQVYPERYGEVTVSIPQGAARDLAGNDNLPSTQPASITHDDKPPTVLISVPNPTSSKKFQNPIPVTVKFNERVYDFSGVKVTNGISDKIEALDNTGKYYTMLVAPWPPSSELLVTIAVPKGAAHDKAGNPNTCSDEITVFHDSVSPYVVSVFSSLGESGNQSPIPITIRFSEPVKGFTANSVTILGGSKLSIPEFGDQYASEFSIQVVPSGRVTEISVNIPADTVTDKAGNPNSVFSGFSYYHDLAPPTVVFESAAGSQVTAQPILVTASFNEPVQGFSLSDVVVVEGVVSDLNIVSESSYSFTLSPVAGPNGRAAMRLYLPASAVTDYAGNVNSISGQLSVDFVASSQYPLITLTTSAFSPTRVSTFDCEASFSIPVVGFNLGDLVISGGNAEEVQQRSDKVYVFRVQADSASSLVKIIVPKGAVQATGINKHNEFPSNRLAVQVDSQAPAIKSLVASIATSKPTTESLIPFTIEFTEKVVNFDVSDITVDGGLPTNFRTVSGSNGAVYTFEVVPSSFMVALAVYVAHHKLFDQAGNQNDVPSPTVVLQHDSISPSAQISSPDVVDGISNAKIISVKITFSESVEGFDEDHLFISGAVLVDVGLLPSDVTAEFRTQTDLVHTVYIKPFENTEITIQLLGGVLTDLAGNVNIASPKFQFHADSQPPFVKSLMNIFEADDSVSVIADFNEPVVLLSADVVLVGATMSRFQAVSQMKYSFLLTPSSLSGKIVVDIPKGSAVDLAGNKNTASKKLAIDYDNLGPSVESLTTSISSPSAHQSFPVVVIFNEPVVSFGLHGVSLQNGSPSNLKKEGPGQYTFDVLPAFSNTEVTIQINAAVAVDASGNWNEAPSSLLTIQHDAEPPAVFISTTVSSPTSLFRIPVEIEFTEFVSGFDRSKVFVSGGQIEDFKQVSDTFYKITLEPLAGASLIAINIEAGAVRDRAGNFNLPGKPILIMHDLQAPRVLRLSTDAAVPTTSTSISVDVLFSENVKQFTAADINIHNGMITDFTALSLSKYRVQLSPGSSSAVIKVNINGGATTDTAGNPNNPATELQITHDSERPIISLFLVGNSPTKQSPVTVKVVLSEDVSGLDESDIALEGAIMSNFPSQSRLTRTFTFDIVPFSSSTVTVRILEGSVVDAAGNANLASNKLLIDYDTILPHISTFGSTIASPSASSPIPFVVVWSEVVENFSPSSMQIVGAIVSSFKRIQRSGEYHFEVIPDGASVNIELLIPGGETTDLAGNLNSASDPVSFIFDSEPFMVHSIKSLDGNPTNSVPIQVMIEFNKPALFSIDQLSIQGATASTLAQITDKSFTFYLTPDKDEVDIGIGVEAAAIEDISGKLIVEMDDFFVRYDKVPPSVEVYPDQSTSNPFVVVVTFSEPVYFFDPNSAVVEGATVVEFHEETGSIYVFKLEPVSTNVEVTFGIPAGAVLDLIGLPNTASPVLTLVYDVEPPIVHSMYTTLAGTTTTSPIPVTVVFSEEVAGFRVEDLVVEGCVVQRFKAVDQASTMFSFELYPTLDNVEVVVSIEAGTVYDVQGNVNLLSRELRVTYDVVVPQVQLSGSCQLPRRTLPISANVTFSEPVKHFALGDIHVSGGIATRFVALSPSTYGFDVEPLSSLVSIRADIPAGVAVDAAGNLNSISNGFLCEYDLEPPMVKSLLTSASNPTSISPVPFTIEFSEPVNGFDLSRISIAGGTAGNLFAIGSAKYAWDVTPESKSVVISVDIQSGIISDLAGNKNSHSAHLEVTYDSILPTVQSLTTVVSNPTSSLVIPIIAVFSDPMTGFAEDDLNVTGGIVQNFMQDSTQTYTFDILPSISLGVISINIAEGVAMDAAGNMNARATPFTVVYDSIRPKISRLHTTAASPSNLSPIPVTASFSEFVVGLEVDHVQVVGGTVDSFYTTDGMNFTFEVTPSSSLVRIVVDFPEGVTADKAGNPNVGSEKLVLLHDFVRPSVKSLSTEVESPTNRSVFPCTVVFSEDVVDFDPSHISVTGGVARNLVQVSGIKYTFEITPSSLVTVVKIQIKGGMVSDAAGNRNRPSEIISIMHDSEVPHVLVMESQVGSPTAVSPIPVTVTWNEEVFDFTLQDIIVDKGVALNLRKVSNTDYEFLIEPIGSQVTITAYIRAASVSDRFGNFNNQTADSDRLIVIHDSEELNVRIESEENFYTSASSIPIRIIFSDFVRDFDIHDIRISSGATGTNFRQVDPTEYSLDLIPRPNADIITVDVQRGVAVDAAGNLNNAALQYVVNYDVKPPEVLSMVSLFGSPSAAFPIKINVTFSEPMANVNLDSLEIENGKGHKVIQESSSNYVFEVMPDKVVVAVTIRILANAVSDLARNTLLKTSEIVVQHDSVPPVVQLSSPVDSGPSSLLEYPLTISMSEPVVDFSVQNISVKGATLENLKIETYSPDAVAYSLSAIPLTPSELIEIVIDAGSVIDAASNKNGHASNKLVFIHDSALPRISVFQPVGFSSPTSISPFSVSLVFSEEILGFQKDDVQVIGGVIVNFDVVSSSGFLLTVAADGPTSDIIFTIPEAAVMDKARNINLRSDEFVIVYDASPPSVSFIETSAVSPSLLNPIPISVEFNEEVIFEHSRIAVTNGNVVQFQRVSARQFTFGIEPASQLTTVTVHLPTGSATDLAGNPSLESTSISIDHDSERPVPQLIVPAIDLRKPTQLSQIPVTVIFNEVVYDFNVGGISAFGATIAGFKKISTTQYHFNILPEFSSVEIMISVLDGATHDEAMNDNIASNPLSISYDTDAPTVRILPHAPSAEEVIILNIVFDEDVLGFDGSDLNIEKGELINFESISPSSYRATVQQDSKVETVKASIRAGAASDAAGIANVASDLVVVTYGRVYVDCGPLDFEDEIRINSQTWIQYRHCDVFHGNVLVDLDFNPTMNKFPSLKVVEGDFVLSGNMHWIDFTAVRSLERIDGKFIIRSCSQLQDLSGLEKITSIGSLLVEKCVQLQNLDALRSLITVKSSFLVSDCPNLYSMSGICSLSEIGQAFSISGCPGICCDAAQDIFSAVGKQHYFDPDEISCQSPCREGVNDFYCDQCNAQSCGDHGTCVQEGSSFRCDCDDGFTDVSCSAVDVCSSDPCQNGAECISLHGQYACLCKDMYTGKDCSVASSTNLKDLLPLEVAVSQTPNVDEAYLPVASASQLLFHFVLPASPNPPKSVKFLLFPEENQAYGEACSVNNLNFVDPTVFQTDLFDWDRVNAHTTPKRQHDELFLRWLVNEDSKLVAIDISEYVLPASGGDVIGLSITCASLNASLPIRYHSTKALDPLKRPKLVIDYDNSALAAPRVLFSRLSDHSSNVFYVFFDRATDHETYADKSETQWCKMVLGENPSDIGKDARCKWLDDRTFMVVMSSDSTLVPGPKTILSLSPNILRNKAGTSPYVPFAVFRVQNPLLPIRPRVSLVGPSRIGGCGSLVLDASGTWGLVSRRGRFSWSVDHPSIVLGSRSALERLELTSEELPKGETVVFTVEVTNVFSRSSSSSLAVSITRAATPILSIVGPAVVLASQDVVLRTDLIFPDCVSSIPRDILQYSWQIEGTNIFDVNRNLVIPRGLLRAGVTYKVTLEVTYGISRLSDVFSVTVLESNLRAVIKGGNRMVASSRSFRIDGSGSFDPDDPFRVRSASWVFNWLCRHVTDYGTRPCEVETPKTSKLDIAASNLPDGQYEFTLVFGDGTRHAIDAVKITITEQARFAPQTEILSQSIVRVNSHEVFTLSGTAHSVMDTPSSELLFSWSESPKNMLQLQDVNSKSLIFEPGVLRNGFKYALSFQASELMYPYQGIASVFVHVTQPPIKGHCSVEPTMGEAFKTSFFLQCHDYLPAPATDFYQSQSRLRYTFHYFATNFEEEIFPLGESDISSAFFMLPEGKWTFVTSIFDDSGAMVQSQNEVNVLPVSGYKEQECHVADMVDGLLTQAQRTKDSNEVLFLADVLMRELNVACTRPEEPNYTCDVAPLITMKQLRSNVRSLLVDTVLDAFGQASDMMLPLAAMSLASATARHDPGRCPSDSFEDENVSERIFTSEFSALERLVEANLPETAMPLLVESLSNLMANPHACSRLSIADELLRNIVLAWDMPDRQSLSLDASNVGIFSYALSGSNQQQLRNEKVKLNLTGKFLDDTRLIVRIFGRSLSECTQRSDRRLLSVTQPARSIVSNQVSICAAINGTCSQMLLENPLIATIKAAVPTYDEEVCQLADGTLVNLRGDPVAWSKVELPECVWWDPVTQLWDDQVCQLGSVRVSSGTESEVTCECSKLGEYAVVLRETSVSDCNATVNFSIWFIGYTVFYSFLEALFVMKLLHLFWKRTNASPRVLTHLLVVLICLTRLLLSLWLSGKSGLQIKAAGLISLICLPQVALMCVLLYTTLHWNDVLSRVAMKLTLSWKLITFGFAGAIVLEFVGLALALAFVESNRQVAMAGLGMVSIISIAIGIIVISVSLIQIVKFSALSKSLDANFMRHFYSLSSFVGFFVIESMAWFAAVAQGSGIFEYVEPSCAVFFFLDICCFVSFLLFLQRSRFLLSLSFRQSPMPTTKYHSSTNMDPTPPTTELQIRARGASTDTRRSSEDVMPTSAPESKNDQDADTDTNDILIEQMRPLTTDCETFEGDGNNFGKVEPVDSVFRGFDDLSIENLHEITDDATPTNFHHVGFVDGVNEDMIDDENNVGYDDYYENDNEAGNTNRECLENTPEGPTGFQYPDDAVYDDGYVSTSAGFTSLQDIGSLTDNIGDINEISGIDEIEDLPPGPIFHSKSVSIQTLDEGGYNQDLDYGYGENTAMDYDHGEVNMPPDEDSYDLFEIN